MNKLYFFLGFISFLMSFEELEDFKTVTEQIQAFEVGALNKYERDDVVPNAVNHYSIHKLSGVMVYFNHKIFECIFLLNKNNLYQDE